MATDTGGSDRRPLRSRRAGRRTATVRAQLDAPSMERSTRRHSGLTTTGGVTTMTSSEPPPAGTSASAGVSLRVFWRSKAAWDFDPRRSAQSPFMPARAAPHSKGGHQLAPTNYAPRLGFWGAPWGTSLPAHALPSLDDPTSSTHLPRPSHVAEQGHISLLGSTSFALPRLVAASVCSCSTFNLRACSSVSAGPRGSVYFSRMVCESDCLTLAAGLFSNLLPSVILC